MAAAGAAELKVDDIDNSWDEMDGLGMGGDEVEEVERTRGLISVVFVVRQGPEGVVDIEVHPLAVCVVRVSVHADTASAEAIVRTESAKPVLLRASMEFFQGKERFRPSDVERALSLLSSP